VKDGPYFLEKKTAEGWIADSLLAWSGERGKRGVKGKWQGKRNDKTIKGGEKKQI